VKLHIGNMPKDLNDAELTELVTPFGATTSVEIVKSKEGESKGFGFVEFANDDHARAAITGLDGKDVKGNALKVSEAKPRKGDNKPVHVAEAQ